MSKYLLAATVLVLAACGEKKAATPAADTAAAATPAPVPAPPAMPDSAMRHDSMAKDTTKH